MLPSRKKAPKKLMDRIRTNALARKLRSSFGKAHRQANAYREVRTLWSRHERRLNPMVVKRPRMAQVIVFRPNRRVVVGSAAA